LYEEITESRMHVLEKDILSIQYIEEQLEEHYKVIERGSRSISSAPLNSDIGNEEELHVPPKSNRQYFAGNLCKRRYFL